jgi:hypothetical protein
MLDRPDGEHDEGEGSFGGVKAVGTVDQEADAPVQAFVAGIVHSKANRRENTGSVLADRLCERDERLQPAAGGL